MAEGLITPEQVAIPQHWAFPEKSRPGFRILQIDVDQGFLAFSLPRKRKPLVHVWSTNNQTKPPLYKGEYGMYFFDGEGKPLDSLVHTGYDTRITLQRGQRQVIQVTELEDPADFSIHTSFHREKGGEANLGSYEYLLHGRLDMLSADNVFAEEDGGDVKGSASLVSRRERPGTAAEDWKFNELGPQGQGFTSASAEEPNEVVLLDKRDGTAAYNVRWDVNQPEEEGIEPVLCLTETNLLAEPGEAEVKILQAPLRIDAPKLAAAIFTPPPYKVETSLGIDVLKVPWMDVGRILGVRLGYTRRPQLVVK